MPSISAPATVLLTGVNGFIASHIAKALLDQGFSVKGTVRSADKGDYVRSLFSDVGSRFQYVIVPDVLTPGVYDEVVIDVDGIIHTNFPVTMAVTEVDDIYKPGIEGTLALLDSAAKFGRHVKRVVLTSSVAVVTDPKVLPYTCSERDWNDTSVKDVEENGAAAGPMVLYTAGKTLQERALFEYSQSNADKIEFDVASVIPGYTVGPMLDDQVKGGVNSTWVTFQGLTGRGHFPVNNIVDVRDVAEAHVRCLTLEDAANQRFLVINQSFTWQDAYDVLHTAQPGLAGVPVGTPGSGKKHAYDITYDSSRSRRVLGLKYRSVEETVLDAWEDIVKRGWIDK